MNGIVRHFRGRFPRDPHNLIPNHSISMNSLLSKLLFAIGLAAALVGTAEAQTYRVNRDELALRSEPSERGGPLTVVGVLRRGDRVSAGHDRWMRVAVESGTLRGKVGYVARRGVDESSWTEERSYLTRSNAGTSYYVTGVLQYTTLRSAMSSGSSALERVPRGDLVVSLDSPSGSGWHYVQVVSTGSKGWISSRFLARN